MFREFEIVFWSCICDSDVLYGILKDITVNGKIDAPKAKKLLLNHLINTAYFTKRQVCDDEQFSQFQAFFDNNFQIFQGKHTDWLLLSEPDCFDITPVKLNCEFNRLMQVYNDVIAPVLIE